MDEPQVEALEAREPKEPKLQNQFSRWSSMILMVAILTVAGLVSALTAMRFAIRGKEVEVPKLVGKTKEEAEQIQITNEQLLTELTETKAAMLSYKNMTEVIADQAKGLKLIIERKKDENENLVNALRELQSNSTDQQRIGKLHYIIMLSRW